MLCLYPYGALCLQCSFTNNTSKTSGGAVTAGNTKPTSIVNITACKFDRNQAAGTGGALILQGVAYIQSTVFDNNTAQSSSGAVDAQNAALTISSTVFHSNTATTNGGAVYTEQPLIVRDTVYIANRAQAGNGGANLSTGYGGAISAQPGSSLIVANSLLSNNSARFASGAFFTFALKNEFVIADTVLFTNNTAACCYVQGGIISSSGTCMDVTGGSGDGADECCLANYYSDGEHGQLCTTELTCAGIVGASSSTVAVATGLWRATITSSKTYSCWNADACIGGVAASSTDGYCAVGYKGP
eukprot:21163-Heterococcus_DN1.PRE.3